MNKENQQAGLATTKEEVEEVSKKVQKAYENLSSKEQDLLFDGIWG